MLFILVFFTIVLGVYPSVLMDVLHYSVSQLIYKSGTEFALALSLPFLLPISSQKSSFTSSVCIHTRR